MAFMMPVVKNEWDIYNSSRCRRTSESATERAGGGGGGRVRKVSEAQSEGSGSSSVARSPAALGPHRSAPAMRSLAYTRPPPTSPSTSRASLPKGYSSPSSHITAGSSRQERPDKFHNRVRAGSPPRRRSRCGACMPYL